MALTEAEAKAVYTAICGLNPRHDNHGLPRPTVQQTLDALTLLAERAGRTMQVSLMPTEREALRRLVDDLYRVQPHDGPAVEVVSWHWSSRPNVMELVEAITAVSGGTVHARQVDDGGQDYILVISRHELDDAAALAAWEAAR